MSDPANSDANKGQPAKKPDAEDRRAFGRRSFFRSGFRELLRPLVDSIDERITDVVNALPADARANWTDATKPQPPVKLGILRPPGALDEPAFAAACSKCGVCVTACPAEAIKIDKTGTIGGGLPYIDPDLAPCVVSTSLDCMMFCPTGALTPVPIPQIDMGTARWNPNTCVRTARGESCTICVDECPIGEVAIRIAEDGRVQVIDDGCVGCGLCQNRCPTVPKSIVVEPKAARSQ